MSLPNLPTFHFVEIAETDTASRRSADAENASRNAVVEIAQISTGVGQQRLPKALDFPVVFRTEPHFTCGSAVIVGAGTNYHDPRGTAGVYAWQRNGRGYYTGAHIWVRVDCEAITTTANLARKELLKLELELLQRLDRVQVQHYLTFSATAIKDLPTSTLTAALTPRTIGL